MLNMQILTNYSRRGEGMGVAMTKVSLGSTISGFIQCEPTPVLLQDTIGERKGSETEVFRCLARSRHMGHVQSRGRKKHHCSLGLLGRDKTLPSRQLPP